MTATEALLAALALPPGAAVNRRVPRTTLLEHGAPTSADRRLIQQALDELTWVAALKPATVGIAAYRDAEREVAEIVVLRASLRPDTSRLARLVELVHRAVPYPVLLLVQQGEAALLSLASKRFAQGGAAAWVVESVESTPLLAAAPSDTIEAAFRDALALPRQPMVHLHATYTGWVACVVALAAARVTGRWSLPTAADASVAYPAPRREALAEHARLVREREAVYRQATRERQLSRRVLLNNALRDLDASIARLVDAL